jgi:hypothetical protein
MSSTPLPTQIGLTDILTIVFGVATIIITSIGLSFFVNWVRKPSLRVQPLPNNPQIGNLPLFKKVEQGSNSPTIELQPLEHKSQHFIESWTEKGESLGTLTDKPRLSMKFSVLKVSNQLRNIKSGIIHSGNATNVKADIRIKPIAYKVQDGRFIDQPQEKQIWSDPMPLNWYREGWDHSIKAMGIESIEESKKIRNSSLYLLEKYLINETLDVLPNGREAYLLLFMTNANMSNIFTPTWAFENRFLGKYRFKISIFSSEVNLHDLLYECEIRDWNDFTITQISNDS